MARNFAGGTDQILDPGPTSTTTIGFVSFWMKTTQTTTVAPVSCWSATSRNGFGFIMNNSGAANKILMGGYSGTTNQLGANLKSTSDVNTGSWVHVAVNFNGNSGGSNELFINGVSEATYNSAGAWAIASVGTNHAFGDPVDTFWSGYVGDLAEYFFARDANMSAANVAAIAKGFSPKALMPGSGKLYLPLVREVGNIFNEPFTTVTGTTVSVHPPMIGGAV